LHRQGRGTRSRPWLGGLTMFAYTERYDFSTRMNQARAHKPASAGKRYAVPHERYQRLDVRKFEHVAQLAQGRWRCDCEEILEAFRVGIHGAPDTEGL
jgi:hypothetical protein